MSKNYKRGLTTKFIESLKPEDLSYRVTDSICENLGVIVHPSERKVFNFRGRINGTLVTRTLGPFPLYSLADARHWCGQIHQARDRVSIWLLSRKPMSSRLGTLLPAPVTGPSRNI